MSKWRTAGATAWRNRRKILLAAAVTVPIMARYVPGFPADEALSVVRILLGA